MNQFNQGMKMSEEAFITLCKALGNETRLAIVRLLLDRKKFCGDLVQELRLPQSTVSHHLKILRNAGLVVAEERGTWVCYAIDQSMIRGLKEWIEQMIL